jgi:hypothetical protein
MSRPNQVDYTGGAARTRLVLGDAEGVIDNGARIEEGTAGYAEINRPGRSLRSAMSRITPVLTGSNVSLRGDLVDERVSATPVTS